MNTTDVVEGEYDTCVNLRTHATRMSRGPREGRPTMAQLKNNIVDRNVACGVNPTATACMLKSGPSQVQAIHGMVREAQRASIRSFETAQQRNTERNTRFRMAQCQKVQEQATGN